MAGHAAVRRGYVDGLYGQLHLRRAGPPMAAHSPLLCIHMSPMTGRIFEPLLSEMGSDRDAIAFDTPGFGLSDPPAAPPSVDNYAAALLDGLAALGIDRPIDILGYHTGSMIAVAMARQAPERVRRIIMIAAPIFTDAELEEFRRHYRPDAPSADGGHLLKRWKGFVYHHQRPGVSLDDMAEAFKDAFLGGAIEWWGHRAAFDFDLAACLRTIATPVLILVTGDDLDVQTRRAAGLAHHGRLLEVPGWGHGFLHQHTSDAASLIRAFLDAPSGDLSGKLTPPPSATAARYPPRQGSFPDP